MDETTIWMNVYGGCEWNNGDDTSSYYMYPRCVTILMMTNQTIPIFNKIGKLMNMEDETQESDKYVP